MPSAFTSARGHRHMNLKLSQFFANMPTNKTSTAENKYFFHETEFSVFAQFWFVLNCFK